MALEKRFARVIENLWSRPGIRQRLESKDDGFLPDLSRFIRIPEAQAAVEAGLLTKAEGLQAGGLISDKHLQAWQSRMGIPSISEPNEFVILHRSAAFDLGLLAVADGVSPNAPVGVVAPAPFHPLVETVRNELGLGSRLMEGEKLEDLLEKISHLEKKPSRITLWIGPKDAYISEKEMKNEVQRFLGDSHLDVEIRRPTAHDLAHAGATNPGIADRIKTFLAAVKSLSIAA